jgi:peptide/nickel transport system substrate-binding protein
VTYAATGSPAGYAIGFESLLGFKNGPSVEYADLTLTPKLAEQWRVSADARTFTFSLRKDVKFANIAPVNGRPLTSKDVKWSYEYSSRSGEFKDKKLTPSTNGFMFEGLEGVDTPDESTVVVRFRDPFVPFLSYAASAWNPVMPQEIYQRDGNFKDRIVGTGPFQLDAAASQKGSRWSWRKNPAYWAEGQPYLDEIRWLVIPDESTMFAAFQTKQVDILEELAYANYQDVAGKSPQIGSYRYLQPRGYFIYFSQAKGGPLTDVRVRRAIALTVDRDAVSQVAAGGQGFWSLPGATPSMFTDAEAHSLQKRDPAEAKRLLAEAGYANGADLKILSPSDDSAVNHAWVQAVQAQLKDVGVRLTLDLQDKATVSARKRQGDYNLDYSISLGQFEADVDSMVVAFRSGAGLNWPRINDPQLDELLDGQRREVDQEKRRELLRKAVLRIVDQAWGVSLIYPPKWSVWQPYVNNYRPNFGVKVQYPQVWLSK